MTAEEIKKVEDLVNEEIRLPPCHDRDHDDRGAKDRRHGPVR